MFFLLSIVLVLSILYYVFKNKHNYWKKRNVPFLQPLPLLGNYGEYIFLKKTFNEVAQKICQAFPDEPYIGTFYGTEPAILIQDPDLIKLAVTKDFYYFNGREINKYTNNEVFTKSLFFTHGDRWKILRQNLTPLFSSGKLKNMFYLIQKQLNVLENHLKCETNQNNVIDLRNLMTRYIMDCVGSCILGIEANTLTNPNNNPCLHVCQKVFQSTNTFGLKKIIRSIWPRIFYSLDLKLFVKEIDDFFSTLIKTVVESRNFEPTSRNDLVDLMLKLNKKKVITSDSIHNISGETKKVSLEFDDDVMVGHAIGFFGAGFDTSAMTMTYLLYELAINEESLKIALEEVDQYLLDHNDQIEYDCLTELPYLDACFNEALRMYPVLGMLTREMEADYALPSGLLLKKGLRVHLPVWHLHYNPKYFPEPEKFRPERFLGEEKKNLKPCTYMPFGEGSRVCIGSRFARMITLPGLLKILKSYRPEATPETPRKLTMDPRSFISVSYETIYLKFVPRNQC